METKPYRIQSPEDIAKDYGGNKQKIAQAMQMGIVDPTAGVLAGMFIDRMRSAQMQEMAPQATVAQKVMGGAPAQAPLAPAGGLGATAPSMPPMAPQGGAGLPPMPEEAPAMAAGGFVPVYMKNSGLDELPIPDGMFDEARDGGYAGGGIVAFAEGDEVKANSLGWLYSPITSLYGAKRSTGTHKGQDFAVGKRTPIGAPAPGKVIKAATDDINGNFVIVRHPDGTTSSYSHLDEITVGEGEDVKPGQVLGLSGNTGNVRGKNGGYHLHFGARDAEGNRIDPTDFFKQIAPQVASGKFSQRLPERDLSKAQGQAGALEDYMRVAEQYTKPGAEELSGEERLRQRYQEMGSDEYYEKQRKDSMWEALATFGANMASSKAPGLLQAIGEAAKATLPGMQADKKERKELKDRALQGLADLGIRDRKRRLEALELGMNLYKTGVEAQQFEKRLSLQEQQVKDEKDYRDAMIGIERYKAMNPNASDLETKVSWVIDQGFAKDPVSAMEYLQKKGLIGAQQGAAGGNAAQTAREKVEAGRQGNNPYAGFSATQVGG